MKRTISAKKREARISLIDRFQQPSGLLEVSHQEELTLFTDDGEKEVKMEQRKQIVQYMKNIIEEQHTEQDENPEELELQMYLAAICSDKPYNKKMEVITQILDTEFYEEYVNMMKQVKNTNHIDLIPMNDIQRIEVYKDSYPLLEWRKEIWLLQKQFSNFCLRIIKSSIFEGICLIIIIWNSVMLAIDDPTTDTQTQFQEDVDFAFLILYTIEMSLKMFAMGVFMNKGAYLRDSWNILDFVIIVTAYIPYATGGGDTANLTALRSLRVLRPLRTISSIKSLRDILSALFAAVKPLQDAIVILLFFFTIFAIAGLQLFMGILKKRCFSEEYGIIQLTGFEDEHAYCSGDETCPIGFICGKMLNNPDHDLISFDTFGWSFLQVFIITTLEGWSQIMISVQRSWSYWTLFYFLTIVLIGAFFLINLTLAIIKVEFSRAQEPEEVRKQQMAALQEEGEEDEDDDEEEEEEDDNPHECYNYNQLIKIGLYQRRRQDYDDTPVYQKYGCTWDQNKEAVKHSTTSRTNHVKRKTVGQGHNRRTTVVVVNPKKTFFTPQINLLDENQRQQTIIIATPGLPNETRKKQRFSNIKLPQHHYNIYSTPVTLIRNQKQVRFQGLQGVTNKNSSVSTTATHGQHPRFIKTSKRQDPTPNSRRGRLQQHSQVSHNTNPSNEEQHQTKRSLQKDKDDLDELDELLNKSKLKMMGKSSRNLLQVSEDQNNTNRLAPSPTNNPERRNNAQKTYVSIAMSSPNHSPYIQSMNQVNTPSHVKVSAGGGITPHQLQVPGALTFSGASLIREQEQQLLMNRAHISNKYSQHHIEVVDNEDMSSLSSFDRRHGSESQVDVDVDSEELEDNLKELGIDEGYYIKIDKPMAQVRRQEPRKQTYKRQEIKQMDRRVVPDMNLVEFDKKTEKLKAKLFMTKFHVRVLNEHYLSNSEYDVRVSKQQELQKKEEAKRQEIIRTTPIQLQHTFNNGKMNLHSYAKQMGKSSRTFLTTKNAKMSQSSKASFFPSSRKRNQVQALDVEEKVDTDLEYIKQNVYERMVRRKPKKEELLSYLEYATRFGENIDEDETPHLQAVVNLEKTKELKSDPAKFEAYKAVDIAVYDSVLREEYNAKRHEDIYVNHGKITSQTSIEDVLLIPESKYFEVQFVRRMNYMMSSLNYEENDYFIWLAGIAGMFLNFRRKTLILVSSKPFEHAMNIAVFINTVILALDGLTPESSVDTLNQFNLSFIIIFTIEMVLKIIGMGPVNYLRDKMNLFDAVIVVLSLVELFIFGGGSSAISAFRSVRIFRAFRVLRATKLMRSLQFMMFILKVVSNALQSFIYIFLLLILFIYIFALLGMAFFGGELSDDIRQNFNSFMSAILTTFQILTMENWNTVLDNLMLSPVYPAISIIYLVLWIFIGNYVFLNLFLAILLDNFEEEWRKDKENLKDQELEIGQDITFTIDESGKSSNKSSMHRNSVTSNKMKQKTSENKIKASFRFADEQEQKGGKKKKKHEFVYYSEEGLCQDSLFIFSQDNIIRRICYRMVKDFYFEVAIFIAIFITSIQLVIATYVKDPNSSMAITLSNMDYFFATFFAVEALMKTIALGFVMDQNSYLRESWSQLDFFIVCTSLIDVSFENIELGFVRILRLLRTLRPLRFISHNRSLKVIVAALLESAGGIVNVAIVVIMSWMMFAILGINLQKNKMNYCRLDDDDESVNYYHYDECLSRGGTWANRDLNFDNIISGMITLFVLSTLEGWPDILYYFIDADEAGPIKDNQTQFAWFFIVFILIGSLFLLNLFIGVILVNYHMADEQARNKALTKDQSNWIELQRLIVMSNPDFTVYYQPESSFRSLFFHIVKAKLFDVFIILCIITNIIIMACQYEGADADYTATLDAINLFFTIVFIVEAAMKLIAFGPKGYFKSGWNQFDFFVVFTSILDLVLDQSGNNVLTFLAVGPQIARVFRVLRVSRLFRLVKKFRGLQKLIETAVYSLPSVLNVTVLLFLVFFIFSILAVFLFQDITTGQVIDDDTNFQDFHHALFLLFRCATGEDWYKVMFDTTKNGGTMYSTIFFILFIMIQQFIMLNLFILIILDQFENNYIRPDNPLSRFAKLEMGFVEMWSKKSANERGWRMSDRYLVELLMHMSRPLGMNYEEEEARHLKRWRTNHSDIDQTREVLETVKMQFRSLKKREASKIIMQMNIYSDQNGFVYYHQILFTFIRHHLWRKIQQDLTAEGAILLKKEEERTNKLIKRKQNQWMIVNDDDEAKVQSVNPVVQFLFVSMSFKAFRRYAEKKKQHKEVHVDNNLDQSNGHFSEMNSSDSSYARDFSLITRHDDTDDEDADANQLPGQPIYPPNTDIYREDYCLYERADRVLDQSLRELYLESHGTMKHDYEDEGALELRRSSQNQKQEKPASQRSIRIPIINLNIQNNIIINQNYYFNNQPQDSSSQRSPTSINQQVQIRRTKKYPP